MQFSISNKLSYTAIGELLKLLGLLCPPDSLLPRSFYIFKKFFQQFKGSYTHKRVCLKCKKDDCSCDNLQTAHLVHMDIHKPLQTVMSSKHSLYCCIALCDNSMYVHSR